MLCESCNKNTAKLHYTKIVNGKVEELHLCESCAMEKQELEFDKSFSIFKLFSNLFENVEEKQVKKSTKICSNCGLAFQDFQTTGKFGCAQCYESFFNEIQPIIKGIQGQGHHRGKVPRNVSPNIALKREVSELNAALEEAVKNEEFEKAAVLRDEIKKVKEKLQRNEG